nr:hypothetical protein [Thermoproteota archaeon]
ARLYSNNTILFNQIKSPERSESITKISQKSALVRSVNQQVRVHTLAGKRIRTIRFLYPKLDTARKI